MIQVTFQIFEAHVQIIFHHAIALHLGVGAGVGQKKTASIEHALGCLKFQKNPSQKATKQKLHGKV